ncbi:class I SAM-dependent methyltransferase [Vulcanococcus sp.]|uniref:class I SAM-dependent methyltransferase n=1 Tax=Vulcanococcus sp. TaxID=2856995 RepID=UPI003C0A95A8
MPQAIKVDPRQFWDARFSAETYAYGTEPNDFLRAQAAALPPGDALCLAEGEGRNAVYLAGLGHRVIAQDLSPVGLGKAEQLARARGVEIQCSCCDLNTFQPEANSTDLVVAIWMHLEPGLRAVVHQRAINALRPGGLFVLEAYRPEQLELGTGGPPSLELLISPEQLRQELGALEIQWLESLTRPISEGPFHQGPSAVVQFAGRKRPATDTN